MMKKLKDCKRICLWIEAEQDKKLQKIAEQQLRSKSDVARILLNEVLKKYEV